MQLGGNRPGDLGRLGERRGQEGEAVPERRELQFLARLAGFGGEAIIAGLEVKFGPAGARDRPVVLVTFDELVGMPHLQADLWLLVPTVLLALEEIAEELFLNLHPVVG